MSFETREAAFQQHLQRSENYFSAVAAADDLPWFAAGNPKRDQRIADMGLSENISDEDLRRALFFKRWQDQ